MCRTTRRRRAADMDSRAGADGGRLEIIVLPDIVESADQIEAVVDGIFGTQPEDVLILW